MPEALLLFRAAEMAEDAAFDLWQNVKPRLAFMLNSPDIAGVFFLGGGAHFPMVFGGRPFPNGLSSPPMPLHGAIEGGCGQQVRP